MSMPHPSSPEAWLARARTDLSLADGAFQLPGVAVEDICFHAQQSAEKALKALLMALQVIYPRTHDLDLLLDLVKGAGLAVPTDVDEASILTPYAVVTRYPYTIPLVTLGHARRAVAVAEGVLAWVEQQLTGVGPGN